MGNSNTHQVQQEIVKPTVLLVFADQDLANIKKERQQLLRLLRQRLRRRADIIPLFYASPDSVIDELEELQEEVAIFHFAGHSNEKFIKLDEGEAYARGLAEYFKSEEKDNPTKLIFLNGCQNKQQVKAFLDAGVGAVIATSKTIDDALAVKFAVRFYKSLTAPRKTAKTTLRQAFEQSKNYILTKDSKDYTERKVLPEEKNADGGAEEVLPYEHVRTGTREIDWSSTVTEDQPEAWGWGIYTSTDKSLNLTLDDVLEPLEISFDWKKWGKWLLIGLSIIAVLFLFSVYSSVFVRHALSSWEVIVRFAYIGTAVTSLLIVCLIATGLSLFYVPSKIVKDLGKWLLNLVYVVLALGVASVPIITLASQGLRATLWWQQIAAIVFIPLILVLAALTIEQFLHIYPKCQKLQAHLKSKKPSLFKFRVSADIFKWGSTTLIYALAVFVPYSFAYVSIGQMLSMVQVAEPVIQGESLKYEITLRGFVYPTACVYIIDKDTVLHPNIFGAKFENAKDSNNIAVHDTGLLKSQEIEKLGCQQEEAKEELVSGSFLGILKSKTITGELPYLPTVDKKYSLVVKVVTLRIPKDKGNNIDVRRIKVQELSF